MKLFILRRAGVTHVLGAVVMACMFGGIAFAQAPSLAELAKKEQERRKATPPAAKVLTDKDLPKPKAPAGAPAAAAPAAPAPATDAKFPPDPNSVDAKKAEEGKEVKDETYWRGRMSAAREELRRAQVFAEALQSRINALSADFVNRDDPYQRAKIGEDRQKALTELERVAGDIEKATKAIADIEEEARQAGVPPGWLR